MSVPSWWELVLLALAAFRLFRLLGYDTILDRPREKILRKARAEAGEYRHEVDVFFHCPWCLGFWVSLGFWGAWQIWPDGTLIAAGPLAISALVGLVTKNLDP